MARVFMEYEERTDRGVVRDIVGMECGPVYLWADVDTWRQQVRQAIAHLRQQGHDIRLIRSWIKGGRTEKVPVFPRISMN